MVRFFLFLVGFGLSVIGFIYLISYLNLLALGYNFSEYVKFICRRPECISAIVGLILIFVTIFKGDDQDNICI